MVIKVGFGYDSHRFIETRKLYLGGVEIPYDRGLAGHSDADVLIHSIADALLGAIGVGDLGKHFPNTDPAYKDISSKHILESVTKMVQVKGYTILHVDSTIVIETPILKDYIPLMTSTMADILGVETATVNVKVKSNEGMGWIGRGEGAAAFAAVTVQIS